MARGPEAAGALPSLRAPQPPPHACCSYVLQHLGVKAEVEAHALCPALFVAGGDGAELAVPGLPAPVPALNLGEETQEAGLRMAATPPVPTPPSNLGLHPGGHPHLLPRLWVDHCLLVEVECSFLILHEKGH